VSEMVERGARALCEAKLWPGAWENETKGNREEWRMLARAMLQSMREPTDSMLACGEQWGLPSDPMGLKRWQEMIDAALETK
jgi:hypothetical protein